MAEINLSTEERAVSGFRVYAYASGLTEASWDGLSDADQQRWFVLARQAPAMLEALEGKSFLAAAMALAEIWAESPEFYAKLPYPLQLAWSAVARHLASCMDSDEMESLETAERFWGDWALERRKA